MKANTGADIASTRRRTSKDEARILPAMASRKVDLPAPEGPTMAVISPWRAAALTSLSRTLVSTILPVFLVTCG